MTLVQRGGCCVACPFCAGLAHLHVSLFNPPAPQWLLNGYSTVTQRLLNGYSTVTQRLLNGYSAVTQRSLRGHSGATQRLLRGYSGSDNRENRAWTLNWFSPPGPCNSFSWGVNQTGPLKVTPGLYKMEWVHQTPRCGHVGLQGTFSSCPPELFFLHIFGPHNPPIGFCTGFRLSFQFVSFRFGLTPGH